MWFILCALGGYDTEDKATKAYDLVALKYWSPATHINFPVSVMQMFHATKREN